MSLIQNTPLEAILRSPWVLGPVVFLVWMAFFYLVKVFLIRALRRMAARTAWTWDDILISSLSGPLLIAVAAGGLVVLGRILPLPPEGDRAFDIMFAASLALALILFVDRGWRGVLDRLSRTNPVLQGVRGLIQGIVRGVIITLGILIFLDSIGIPISPILASLGIGSLAVALALKDTLANVFAGISMIMDKRIEPGQFVRLEEGQEGIVSRVNWRSTWFRMPNNSVVVVPNAKLAESVLTNYSLPDAPVVFPVEIGVHYDSDLEKVERVTLQVARETLESVEGGVPGDETKVRIHAFGESSISFRVLLRAADYDSGPNLRHEFIKRLHRRYRQEGIVIPYPTRTLDLPPDRPASPMGDALRGDDEAEPGGSAN